MDKRVIVIVTIGAIAGISILVLPASLAILNEPYPTFLDGPCTDMCTVVFDVNNNGVCEQGIDAFTVISATEDPYGRDLASSPLCP